MEFLRTVGAIAVLAVAAVFIIIFALLVSGENKDPEIQLGAGESAGPRVYVNGNLKGAAPVRIELAPNKAYKIDFKKGAYYFDISDKGTTFQKQWSFVLDLMGITRDKETITFEPPRKLSDQELLKKAMEEPHRELTDSEKKAVEELIRQARSGEQLTPRQVANVKKGLAPGPP